MKRKIIRIDENRCDGCGECIVACHEGALQVIDGKARLISDIYCDGLGDCLGECPQDAITLEERESLAYNQEAVDQRLAALSRKDTAGSAPADSRVQTSSPDAAVSFSCPGSRSQKIDREAPPASPAAQPRHGSQLQQWPCQIKLVPTDAPYFDNCHLLIAADCTAYAYANIHDDFMKNRVTLIGCPKLDAVDYRDKLIDILATHKIKSVTVLKMLVPCCGGLGHSVVEALQRCGKMIPWNMVTIGTDGSIIED